MDDKTIQRKLNQLVKIVNELDDEARRRYGQDGQMFYESGGTFYMMEHDRLGHEDDRQEGIRFASDGVSRAHCGAW